MLIGYRAMAWLGEPLADHCSLATESGNRVRITGQLIGSSLAPACRWRYRSEPDTNSRWSPRDGAARSLVGNIARQVCVYRARPASAPASAIPAATTLPLPDKPSIAVLPFQNMSSDPEQEYFVDGMA